MSVPDFNFYPDELSKVAIVMARLSNAFDFSALTEKTKAIFEIAAREEFAKIGLEIRINWQHINRKTGLDTEEPTGVWIPGVEPVGRLITEIETDHDRVRWGVVKGLADGQPGYIRADGRKTEEPRKKNIL